MFRFLFSLLVVAVVVYFAATVQLGKKTLFGHLVAIFSTPQAKDLADGAKEEAKKVADRLRADLHPDAGSQR